MGLVVTNPNPTPVMETQFLGTQTPIGTFATGQTNKAKRSEDVVQPADVQLDFDVADRDAYAPQPAA